MNIQIVVITKAAMRSVAAATSHDPVTTLPLLTGSCSAVNHGTNKAKVGQCGTAAMNPAR